MKKSIPPGEKRLRSKDSLYFPSVQGSKWKNIDSDIRWDVDDVINHIFPKEYQEKSYEYAVKLTRFLLDNPRGVDKNMLSEFIKSNNIPVSTMYNVIIPKMVRFGLFERRRESNISNPTKGWFLILKPSMAFSSHLQKLADEWRSIYKTAISKK
ncbi:MAG: hypothetical protein J7K87_01375 [Candidatus Aenigmarchaeota archaeon]|nr:hypothetical protein [Candidatus Aenigmarchaeota archaeon]